MGSSDGSRQQWWQWAAAVAVVGAVVAVVAAIAVAAVAVAVAVAPARTLRLLLVARHLLLIRRLLGVGHLRLLQLVDFGGVVVGIRHRLQPFGDLRLHVLERGLSASPWPVASASDEYRQRERL